MKAIVKTANDGTLNLRATPNGGVIARIPNGTELDVELEGEWAYTTYNNLKGYVKASFLSHDITKEQLRKVYNSLQQTLKTIEGVLK